MGYYTGSANNMGALRSALVDACTSEGWSWNGSTQELAKGSIIVKIEVLAEHLQLIGRVTSGSTVGESPLVRMGRFSGHASWALSWPMTYHIHAFSNEVYLVAVYDIDKHLWLALGKSTVEGLPGTGTWLGSCIGSGNLTASNLPLAISAEYGGNSSYGVSPALFHSDAGVALLSRNCWVNHNLDGAGWLWGSGENANPCGTCRSARPLLGLLPNTWNSEAVLLPCRAFVERPSNKISLIADCEHARITRNDNYAPGQIIDIGGTRWKIYPWFQKNSAARTGGGGITHTGTFAWAIKYEGP